MTGHATRLCLLTSGLAVAAVLLTGCPRTPVVVSGTGAGTSVPAGRQTAPSRPPPAPSTDYVRTAALGDVHFDVDRVTIRSADRAVLDANAEWLRSNTEARLLLLGFADERGTSVHNQALGERRASAVRDALVAQGIGASRITIRSLGEGRPLCTERTDACWARKRRVQFLVSQ